LDKELIDDIIQWGVSNWKKLIPIWDKELANHSGNAIAFGEREGGLSLYLAQKGFKVTCTDYNDFPEELPLLIHTKYQIEDNITYKKEDITNVSYDDNSFDIVVFKSVIGVLGSFEEQKKALLEIHRILKPGGVLLFAENLKSSKLHQMARKKFTNWGHRWYYPSIEELKMLNSSFSNFEYHTTGFFATFGRNEKQRNVLAKIDNLVIKIIPKNWRYIVIGKSIK
jgi:ubiquinone/menaquinone biosynthesis C-methylase UbiE